MIRDTSASRASVRATCLDYNYLRTLFVLEVCMYYLLRGFSSANTQRRHIQQYFSLYSATALLTPPDAWKNARSSSVSSLRSAFLDTRSFRVPSPPRVRHRRSAIDFFFFFGLAPSVARFCRSFGGRSPLGAVHQDRDRGGRVLAEGAGAAVLQTFGRRRDVFVMALN